MQCVFQYCILCGVCFCCIFYWFWCEYDFQMGVDVGCVLRQVMLCNQCFDVFIQFFGVGEYVCVIFWCYQFFECCVYVGKLQCVVGQCCVDVGMVVFGFGMCCKQFVVDCLVYVLDGGGNVIGYGFVDDEEIWFDFMCLVIVVGVG